MKCERIQTLLEEYFDDELGASEAREVEAHLAGCEACASALESIESEAALYSRYDRGFEPSPGMWAGVLARIEPDGARRLGRGDRFRQWIAGLSAVLTPGRLVPLAVAACAVVVVGVVGFRVLQTETPPPPGIASVVEPPSAPPVAPAPTIAHVDPQEPTVVPTANPSGSLRPVRHTTSRPDGAKPPKADALQPQVAKAEQNYLAAIAVLTKDVERGGGPIDPKLRKPLDDIDRNITTARDAVKKNPDDPTAVLNMLSAYDEKVEVLQTLARFETSRNR
jgi:hypothetical protein